MAFPTNFNVHIALGRTHVVHCATRTSHGCPLIRRMNICLHSIHLLPARHLKTSTSIIANQSYDGNHKKRSALGCTLNLWSSDNAARSGVFCQEKIQSANILLGWAACHWSRARPNASSVKSVAWTPAPNSTSRSKGRESSFHPISGTGID